VPLFSSRRVSSIAWMFIPNSRGSTWGDFGAPPDLVGLKERHGGRRGVEREGVKGKGECKERGGNGSGGSKIERPMRNPGRHNDKVVSDILGHRVCFCHRTTLASCFLWPPQTTAILAQKWPTS